MSLMSKYKTPRVQPSKKKFTRAQTSGSYLPSLERLEDRTVLNAVNWINGAGGDWDTAANWVDASNSSHHVPGPTDDVTINIPANVTITHNQNVTDSIHSLAAIDVVQLGAGTLDVSATLSSTNSFLMMGGTLGNAVVQAGTTITGTTSGGTLAAVTLDGTLDLTTANSVRMAVTGGLTLNGTVTVGGNAGNFAFLSFNGGDQALNGSGSVLFGNSNANTLWTGQSSGTNLTIGPSILIHGQSGVIGINLDQLGGFSNATFTNQGTIDADGAGGAIHLNGVNWTNTGTIEGATGTTISLEGTWGNNGAITAAANAILDLGAGSGAWTDKGSITAAANSTVNLGGTTSTSTLGNFNTSGAVVNVVGTLTNAGATLTLTDTSGAWHLMGGTIDGGILATTGTNALTATTAGGTLADDVTLNGNLDLTQINNGRVSVTGGLTLGAGTVLQIGSNTGNFAFLSFNGGNQNLDGSGSILFGNSNANTLWTGQSSSTNLTIGPNILIHGQSGVIGINPNQLGGFSNATFTNQGTIDADVAGGAIHLNGVNWSNATSGTIEAASGATISLEGTWGNNGAITAAANAILDLGTSTGAWTNSGSITAAANSTVNLGGTTSTSTLGNFNTSGAIVNVVGTLTNAGATLTLTNTSGAWHLMGGTIDGGILATTGTNALTATISGGTLADDVTLNGDLDLTQVNNGHVTVTGGLTLGAGTVLQIGSNTGNFAFLSFNGGNQNLDGSGSILFGNSIANTLWTGQSSGTNLTISPNILIHGQSGVIGINPNQLGGFSNATFTNQGTIDADVAGGAIHLNDVNWSNATSGIIEAASGAAISLEGTWSNNGAIIAAASAILDVGASSGIWTNNGPITAAANSTVNLGGAFSLSTLGSFSTSGAIVNIVGTLTNTGATLNLTDASGSWRLLGGAIVGGTVATTGSNALIATTSGGTLAGNVTLDGNLDLTQAVNVHVSVTGGLTLAKGTVLQIGSNTGNSAFLSFNGGNQTLDGSGSLLFGSAINNTLWTGQSAGTNLTIGTNILIHGQNGVVGANTAQLGGFADGTFINLGIIDADVSNSTIQVNGLNWTNNGDLEAQNGGSLVGIGTSSNFAAGTLTGGTWEALSNSTLRIINDNITTNSATIILDGTNSNLFSDTGTTNALANFATTTAAGNFTIRNGRNFSTAGSFSNAGVVAIGTGSDLRVASGSNYTQSGGDTSIAGVLNTAGGATNLNLQGGQLDGNGTVAFTGVINSGGQVDPGVQVPPSPAAPGMLTILGNYTQSSGATLNLRFGGTASGSFDQLAVSGNVQLAGTVAVALINGFAPANTNSFPVVTFASNLPTSDFTTKNLPILSGLIMEEMANPTNVTLVIALPPAFDPDSLPADTINVAYNQTLTAIGGTGKTSLVVSNIQNAVAGLDVPPSGINTLAISGTPTATGTETFTVSSTDSLGATTQANYSITVNPALSIAPVSLPEASANVEYDQILTVGGGTAPYTTIDVTHFDGGTTGLTMAGFTTNTVAGTIEFTGTPSAPGFASFTANVTDTAGATLTQNYTITVGSFVVGTPMVSPTTTSEGTSTSFNLSGAFSDPGGSAEEPFIATINWGDNTTDTATVTGTDNPFNYSFAGNHTYAQSGSFNVTVAVTDMDGGTGTSAPVLISVANVPPIVATPTISPTNTDEGASTSFNVTGTFTDPANALDQPFTTVINWGDNTSDIATVTGTGNPFGYSFSGNHNYAQSGNYSVTVSVTDKDGGIGTSAPVAVSVANVPPTVGTPTVSPTNSNEGASTNFNVAGMFTDPADALDEPFTAVINWGDNTTDTAAVTGAGNPFNYSFTGNHTYAQSGNYNVTVSVTDMDGGTGTSAPVVVSVANVPPSVDTPTVSPANTDEGASTNFNVTGSFTDPANALDEPFTAVVNWGDNTTNTATVTGTANPFNYSFAGNHAYTQSGNYNVTVSVTDKDGGTGTSAPDVVSVANIESATHFSINVPPGATTGTAIGFTATALDALNNTVTGYTGTLHFASSDGSASLPADTTLTDGTGSFIVTLNATGNQTITATDTSHNSITGTSNAIAVSGSGTGNKNTYVQQLYVDLLHRNADPQGLQFATQLLNDGSVSRSRLVLMFEASLEYHAIEVEDLYEKYLGRLADPQGLAVWEAFLGNGGTMLQLEANILGSPEYFAVHGGSTEQGFVDAIYSDVLGRSPDPAGAMFFEKYLANGGSHVDLAELVLNSLEDDTIRLKTYYEEFLRREIDAVGQDFWTNLLEQGVPDEVVLAGTVGSNEYFNQFHLFPG